jgi:hypothetical protein
MRLVLITWNTYSSLEDGHAIILKFESLYPPLAAKLMHGLTSQYIAVLYLLLLANTLENPDETSDPHLATLYASEKSQCIQRCSKLDRHLG